MPPKNRRGGLRSNPLDAVIPDPAASAPQDEPTPEPESAPAVTDSAPETTTAAQAETEPAEPAAPAKAVDPAKPVKFNGYVSPEHADRARDALYVLPGEWTTGRFLEHAIDLALADLAEQYNGGKPFAKRPAGQGLRRGPRIT
ncbi:hypothetical protein [Kineococcus sp. SYSU DK003]|uniref:hypothetical protein n=1 Tax=Kineococcus sp. SYSU DK003 TaxID=3383124 RepID=UPI003D7C81FF